MSQGVGLRVDPALGWVSACGTGPVHQCSRFCMAHVRGQTRHERLVPTTSTKTNNRRTTTNNQQTTNNKQQATSNKQQATTHTALECVWVWEEGGVGGGWGEGGCGGREGGEEGRREGEKRAQNQKLPLSRYFSIAKSGSSVSQQSRTLIRNFFRTTTVFSSVCGLSVPPHSLHKPIVVDALRPSRFARLVFQVRGVPAKSIDAVLQARGRSRVSDYPLYHPLTITCLKRSASTSGACPVEKCLRRPLFQDLMFHRDASLPSSNIPQ